VQQSQDRLGAIEQEISAIDRNGFDGAYASVSHTDVTATVATFVVQDHGVLVVLSHDSGWQHAEAAQQTLIDSITIEPLPYSVFEQDWESRIAVRSNCPSPFPAPRQRTTPSWIIDGTNLLLLPGSELKAKADSLVEAKQYDDAVPFIYWGVRRRNGEKMLRLANLPAEYTTSECIVGYWKQRALLEESVRYKQLKQPNPPGIGDLLDSRTAYWQKHDKRQVLRISAQKIHPDSPVIFILPPWGTSPKSFFEQVEIQSIAEQFQCKIIGISGRGMQSPRSFSWRDRDQIYRSGELKSPRLGKVIDSEYKDSPRDIVIVAYEGAGSVLRDELKSSEPFARFGKCCVLAGFGSYGDFIDRDYWQGDQSWWSGKKVITATAYERGMENTYGVRAMKRIGGRIHI